MLSYAIYIYIKYRKLSDTLFIQSFINIYCSLVLRNSFGWMKQIPSLLRCGQTNLFVGWTNFWLMQQQKFGSNLISLPTKNLSGHSKSLSIFKQEFYSIQPNRFLSAELWASLFSSSKIPCVSRTSRSLRNQPSSTKYCGSYFLFRRCHIRELRSRWRWNYGSAPRIGEIYGRRE